MDNIDRKNSNEIDFKENDIFLEQYRQHKILPHINEQYEFRITNRLLIEKIINPRRDKIIIDSLMNTTCKYFSKKKKQTQSQISINFRRKLIGNNNKNSATIYQNHNMSKQRQRLINLRQNKNKKQDDTNEQKQIFDNVKQDLTKSGWFDTQSSSLRDNFIGKIVRNSSSKIKIPSKRRENLSNFCQDSTTSNQIFQIPAKGEFTQNRRLKINCNPRRLIKKNYQQFLQNKQNEIIQ